MLVPFITRCCSSKSTVEFTIPKSLTNFSTLRGEHLSRKRGRGFAAVGGRPWKSPPVWNSSSEGEHEDEGAAHRQRSQQRSNVVPAGRPVEGTRKIGVLSVKRD